MAKQVTVRVTPEFIADFLKAKEICVVINSPIPVDAKLVGFFERQNEFIGPINKEIDIGGITRTFYFVFEHESFNEIPEGGMLPIVRPWINKK